MKKLSISNEQLSIGAVSKHSGLPKRGACKQRHCSFLIANFSLLIALLLFASCDLFTGPKVDLFQQISDEVDWAKAEKLTVRIDYPSAWGRSNPPQGDITPTKDIRQGYEFSLEFTPDIAYTLKSWQVYYTSDLDEISGQEGQIGNWLYDPSLIAKKGFSSLDPSEVTLPTVDIKNAQGGTYKFTILTDKPVTLVPWCEMPPRITRTSPLNRLDPPVSMASAIAIYFSGELKPETVKFADAEGGEGIWIKATSADGSTVTPNKNGGLYRWYNEPVFNSMSGFFMVTISPKTTLPPGNSKMTVDVKGIEDIYGVQMEGVYSFSWMTRASSEINSWSAEYTDSGSINVDYSQTGTYEVKTYYRLNNGSNIPFTRAINSVQGIDASGVREGRQISGIREYEIFIELYEGSVAVDFTSFKIWNFQGMKVSDTSPAVEIRTMTELAAIKDSLDKQYVLANDITVSGEWTPVGSEAIPFTGKFYGNGHTITVSNNFADAMYTGVFGSINGAEIRDLSVYYAGIVSASDTAAKIGGLVGNAENGATLRNIIVIGASGAMLKHEASDSFYIKFYGGVVGYMEGASSKLENVYSALNMDITSSTAYSYAGGIVGQVSGCEEGSLLNCVFAANTNLNVSAKGQEDNSFGVGGIAGCISGNGVLYNSNKVSVAACYSRGNLNVRNIKSLNVGGLIGILDNYSDNNKIVLEKCVYEQGFIYVQPEKTNASSLNLGGVIGDVRGGALNACYSRALRVEVELVSCDSFNFGGFCGSLSNSRINNCGNTSPILISDTSSPLKGFLRMGGFCGVIANNNSIDQCWSEGNVSALSTKDSSQLGGFAGSIYKGTNLSSCYAKGNVETIRKDYTTIRTVQPLSIGGFAGYSEGDISKLYASGSVNVISDYSGEVCAGGLLGNTVAGVTDCYALGNVLVDYRRGSDIGTVYAGGLVGNVTTTYEKIDDVLISHIEGMVKHCFASGSIEVKSAANNISNIIHAGGISGNIGSVDSDIGRGMVLNNVALGSYIISKGIGSACFRIIGGTDTTITSNNLNGNYAIKDMKIGIGTSYWDIVTEEPVSESETGVLKKDGADIPIIEDDFYGYGYTMEIPLNYYATFWTGTMGFNTNTWSTANVGSTGFPILKWEIN